MTNADLSTKAAAKLLGVSLRTVQEWFRDGVFPNAYKLNPDKRNSPIKIPRSDIESFLAKRQPIAERG